MSEVEVNTYSLRDLRYFWVYCRFCGRSSMFWNRLKHTKRCTFADAFTSEFEAARPEPGGEGGDGEQ